VLTKVEDGNNAEEEFDNCMEEIREECDDD
jgi:hypothetical protein